MIDTDNFLRKEFLCDCCGDESMSQEFVDRLQEARSIAKIGFKITDGYRCARKQKEIRENPKLHTVKGISPHQKGLAVDIRTKDGFARAKIIMALIMVGFTRFGIAKNFIHVDMDFDRESDYWWWYSY